MGLHGRGDALMPQPALSLPVTLPRSCGQGSPLSPTTQHTAVLIAPDRPAPPTLADTPAGLAGGFPSCTPPSCACPWCMGAVEGFQPSGLQKLQGYQRRPCSRLPAALWTLAFRKPGPCTNLSPGRPPTPVPLTPVPISAPSPPRVLPRAPASRMSIQHYTLPALAPSWGSRSCGRGQGCPWHQSGFTHQVPHYVKAHCIPLPLGVTAAESVSEVRTFLAFGKKRKSFLCSWHQNPLV